MRSLLQAVQPSSKQPPLNPLSKNTGPSLLAALAAAACGMLSIALVVAAITLPAAVLIYIHDHDVWREEPITVVGGAFLLSLATLGR